MKRTLDMARQNISENTFTEARLKHLFELAVHWAKAVALAKLLLQTSPPALSGPEKYGDCHIFWENLVFFSNDDDLN